MTHRRLIFALVLAIGSAPAAVYARTCESLASPGSPTATVTLAQAVDDGTFTLPSTPGPRPPGASEILTGLPPFCRVVAQFKPTADSDIHAEIWLPAKGWNGKFLAVGSGGWGGAIGYDAMADALRRGYATSGTDDGHSGAGGSFVVGHPEKFIDFAYRAEHEMTVEAKTLIAAFYGSGPAHSYWNGCSGGGREGLLQAARYPEEFDGVIAGDPANVRRNAWALWLAVQTFKDPAATIAASKYPLVHQFVLQACDARDGLQDGLISDPPSCHVSFKTLECKAGDAPDCLTARQVQTAQTIISPVTTASGVAVFPRLEPGTELQWGRLAGGPNPADLFLDQFRYLIYQDPQWNWRSFDLERDFAKANAANRNIVEMDPNLGAFARRGGKLLLYHGWADQQVAPGSSVAFYQSALEHSPRPAQSGSWIRLFMVPGMGHCSGGEGPDTFDKLSALEQWVEHGKAPDSLIASHLTAGKVDRTRPLCPYPQMARYKGAGSIDDAANFSCR